MVYISGGNELLDPNVILERLGVKIGSKLADLGCGGAGHFIIPAAQMVGKNTNVYAVDILKSVLKSVTSKARLEGVNNIKTIWSNLEIPQATKIKDNELDFALLINILFQSKNDKVIIAEAKRMLKDGGRLLVIDWNNVPASFGPPNVDRVSSREIKTIASQLKLALIDEFDAGNYHYGLIFEK
ncbi:MAG: methyltransferase domain-containing protein [Patescibacteria group bacterium]|jgi:ubiquinone/menaquinone biosynthesis C-methylase UbiE|nr:methyltransferase domain-containing protein [Patescibacteria group bacterium]